MAASDEFSSMQCPITHDMMRDPVIASDGHSYEREAIERWFSMGKNTSPKTNAVLTSLQLTPNHSLRQTIEEYQSRTVEASSLPVPPTASSIPVNYCVTARSHADSVIQSPKILQIDVSGSMQQIPVLKDTEGRVIPGARLTKLQLVRRAIENIVDSSKFEALRVQ